MSQAVSLEVMQNYEHFWLKRQGHTFRVTAGPFENQTGVLQSLDFDKGEIVFPTGEHRIEHLWMPYQFLEEVCCKEPQPA